MSVFTGRETRIQGGTHLKYHSVITRIGSDALHFLKEEVPFIILFDENVPAELAEIAVLHKPEKCWHLSELVTRSFWEKRYMM